jgi:hypothetical protein
VNLAHIPVQCTVNESAVRSDKIEVLADDSQQLVCRCRGELRRLGDDDVREAREIERGACNELELD